MALAQVQWFKFLLPPSWIGLKEHKIRKKSVRNITKFKIIALNTQPTEHFESYEYLWASKLVCFIVGYILFLTKPLFSIWHRFGEKNRNLASLNGNFKISWRQRNKKLNLKGKMYKLKHILTNCHIFK